MAESLLSVGLDVGTTTTQLVVSRLTAENRASAFAVPDMQITRRQVLYESPVHFTPLLGIDRIDGEAVAQIVRREYEKAGIRPETVDSGAVIITGETSRKENAAAVVAALSAWAGEFVVATAGPELESVLAARGAGATELPGRVLHMDIGGGTSNLALLQEGELQAAGCLNVGGRLVKADPQGRISYVSPVLEGIFPLGVGDLLTEAAAMELARTLAGVLEMAAGLREKTELFFRLTTAGTQPLAVERGVTVSFSGGVADCIEKEVPWLAYGDIGPCLGRAIRESRLCQENYRLGRHTIRATVIGAGCHSVQLSGSTVYAENTPLPLKNLPVAALPMEQLTPRNLEKALSGYDTQPVLALPGWENPSYAQIAGLAELLAKTCRQGVYVALEADMAKALGQALALRLPGGTPCLCVDRVRVQPHSYLDVGKSVGPALRLVVKTLVFEK